METVIHHRHEFVLYSLRLIEPMKVDMHRYLHSIQYQSLGYLCMSGPENGYTFVNNVILVSGSYTGSATCCFTAARYHFKQAH